MEMNGKNDNYNIYKNRWDYKKNIKTGKNVSKTKTKNNN